jgi:hypothetical protein
MYEWTLQRLMPQGNSILMLKVITVGLHPWLRNRPAYSAISRDVLQVQQGSLYPALHRLENGYRGRWKETETDVRRSSID